jgi:hypothetical protein
MTYKFANGNRVKGSRCVSYTIALTIHKNGNGTISSRNSAAMERKGVAGDCKELLPFFLRIN